MILGFERSDGFEEKNVRLIDGAIIFASGDD